MRYVYKTDVKGDCVGSGGCAVYDFIEMRLTVCKIFFTKLWIFLLSNVDNIY